MKTNLYDQTTLKNLRLSDWTTYLRSHGWQEIQRNDKAVFWTQYQDHEAYEVLLPLRHDLADFSARIDEALTTLSVFEQRSPAIVLNDIIEEAGRLFRATRSQEVQQIEGLVISLHREKEKTAELVTIMAFVDGKPRKVRVELDEKDYNKAIQAHKEHIPIFCEGELIKEGRSFILNHPRNFSLEPDE